MEPVTILLWGVNILLGIVCYFLKTEHNDIKEANRATNIRCDSITNELQTVKDKYFKKEDFSEFKKELWARLDRMEDDFTRQLQEIKK